MHCGNGAGPGGVEVVELMSAPAVGSGLRRGDVIVMMNSRPVEGVTDFAERVAELPGGRSVALLVERDSGPQFIAIEVPEAE